jgi:hypothetical protein
VGGGCRYSHLNSKPKPVIEAKAKAGYQRSKKTAGDNMESPNPQAHPQSVREAEHPFSLSCLLAQPGVWTRAIPELSFYVSSAAPSPISLTPLTNSLHF